MTEELGFGESAVGRGGTREVEGRVNQLLSLLPVNERQYSSFREALVPMVLGGKLRAVRRCDASRIADERTPGLRC